MTGVWYSNGSRRTGDGLIGHLAARWGAIALRGIAAVAFGVLALVFPGLTVAVLVLLFGLYAIVDGIAAIIAGVRGEGDHHSWGLILVGVAGLVAGLVAWLWPGLTALALLLVIGAWAVVTGALEVIAAIRYRSEMRHEWLLALAGVLSFLFGLMVILFPGTGALAIVWLIAVWAIVTGLSLLLFALRLRGHAERFAPGG